MPIEHPAPSPATVKQLYGNALKCACPGCEEPLSNTRLAGERFSSAVMIENVALYPVELLRDWKAAQLREFDASLGGWPISDDEAAEVINASIAMPVTFNAGTINLGGGGGNAPGAAGGGGAAIGPGALGGPGGNVGRIKLDGEPGGFPSAGGGGGGAMAPGAIRLAPRAESEPTEGVGWSSGIDGQDGGDTTLSVGDEVLLRAEGGQGGLGGTGHRQSTDRLRVSAVLPVNYGEVHSGGLVSLLGGAWQNVSVLNVPSHYSVPLIIVFEAGGVSAGEYTAAVEVRRPTGDRRGYVSFPVTVERAGDVCRIPRPCNVDVEIDAFGLWTIAVTSDRQELALIDVMIKRTGQQ